MFCPTRKYAGTLNSYLSDGFSLTETMVALTVGVICIFGAFALIAAVEKHYSASVAVTDMYDCSRLAMGKLFRDISETSNTTITVQTTEIRSEDGSFRTALCSTSHIASMRKMSLIIKGQRSTFY